MNIKYIKPMWGYFLLFWLLVALVAIFFLVRFGIRFNQIKDVPDTDTTRSWVHVERVWYFETFPDTVYVINGDYDTVSIMITKDTINNGWIEYTPTDSGTRYVMESGSEYGIIFNRKPIKALK